MKYVTYILVDFYIYTCNKQIGKHIPVPWILQVPQNVDIHSVFFPRSFSKVETKCFDILQSTSDRDVVGMAGISSQRWGQFSSLQKVEMIPGNPRSTYVGIPGTLLVWDPGVKGCKTMVSPYYLTIQHMTTSYVGLTYMITTRAVLLCFSMMLVRQIDKK